MNSSLPVNIGLSILATMIVVSVLLVLLVPLFKGAALIVRQAIRFVVAMVRDVFRLIGSLVTMFVFAGLSGLSVVFGRWSRAEHFGRALSAEGKAAFAALYRLAVGHPLRLIGAEGLVEGLEQRVPQAVSAAPPPTSYTVPVDHPAEHEGQTMPVAGAPTRRAATQFPGYSILGTLPGGGSGGRLYIARPDSAKLAALERQGFGAVGDVVIKSFALSGPGGSTLPQIVRENRALEAAKRLGLVLEHELANDRFFYVMRYVPGDSLGLVTQRLHAASGSTGLAGKTLSDAVGYLADLVGTLADYHKAGLWHKDVKPDNIIISGGHAHLVDFGLVTPLRSSMTLTTHGTEYFRDPELVRLAMKGVKVHEVDGGKFDLYAAGAVLFSVIENSFPAHGGLSQISKACPETLRWIVRRAMTDYDKRYPSATAMLADLREVHRAALEGRLDSLRPADLPSVRDGDGIAPPPLAPTPEMAYHAAPPAVGRFHGRAGSAAPRVNQAPRRSAADQLASARTRAAEARRRVTARLDRRASHSTKPGRGVVSAAVFLGSIVFLGVMIFGPHRGTSAPASNVATVVIDGGSNPEAPPSPPAQPEQARVSPEAQTAMESERARLLAEADRLRAQAESIAAAIRSGTSAAMETLKTKPAKRSRASASKPSIDHTAGRGSTVLVVYEPAGLPPQARQAATKLVSQLADRGFAIVGNVPEPSGVEASGELEAGLRAELGLKVIPGPEARDAVGRWLAANPTVDAVLWISRSPDDASSALRWLVLSDTARSGPAAALREIVQATPGR